MRSPRVTLKDVAAASGVSQTTVSFVLNNTRGQTIPEATRRKVQEAASSLGYVADGIGRALREGASRVVLLDVGQIRGGTVLEEFILGMSDELVSHGYSLLVQHGTHDHALQTAIAAISPRAVVDIAGPFAAIDPSNPEGGRLFGVASHALVQLRYLADRGHTHIAFGYPNVDHGSMRVQHIREAADELAVAELSPFTIGGNRAETMRSVAKLRQQHPNVTAIAASDDQTAIAILAALADLGGGARSLAVIGFGDSDFAALWSPALTTVHVHAEQLGKHAAQIALGMEHLPTPVSGSHVVVRESA